VAELETAPHNCREIVLERETVPEQKIDRAEETVPALLIGRGRVPEVGLEQGIAPV